MKQRDMTIYEHISELRKRLMFIVVFFFIAFVGSFFITEPIILFLQQTDEAAKLQLNAFKITDPLKIYMQMAFVIACLITSPIILLNIWLFVSPGLYEKERKVTLSYIPISVCLFLLGIAFSYFILFPFFINFMIRLGDKLAINQVIGINEYFQFLFQITIPFGFLFQLPVIILFLTRLGMITPMILTQIRKYAYFILLVIAAFITPPDIISHLMVTLPLLLLYEFSIIVSKFAYRKVLQAEQEMIKEELA
ncbi:twin-arginine translocase subunit TatC [Bacillus kwashiorkori]|uniref:twin-arginine translocase subunit TatC n=1 Tax=Bacillus kwashiorkori TaxID=1522318 RepID=UPI00078564D4|nr:twin-arginine translocase subunit TatC [Bacillus kwashiorkori]